MDNYYNSISEGYEELHKEEQERKLTIVKANLKVKKQDKLLDVGCGTGLTSQYGCEVTGLDPSKKLLDKNHLKNKVLAPAEDMPFKDNSFDIVTSITAIQNFRDIEKGLNEIKRVGKSRFVLSFLKKSSKKDMIDKLIKKLFKVDKTIEDQHDFIYFCRKN